MTEGDRHVIDPDGLARQALRAAVAEHGPMILSNPAALDVLCRRWLSGLPGEFILIGSAARSDVPALLRQRTASLSIEDAIRSVAVTVAATHGLDQVACVWVVTEFAGALGYRLAGETPSAANAPPSSGPTDRGAPPSSEGAPLSSGGATAEGTTPPPSRRGPSRAVLGLAAAGALVAVYLVVAAGAHLIPFSPGPPPVIGGGSPSATPDVVADTSADASPDPAPDPDPDASALDSLLSLIPADIQSGDSCSQIDPPFGATVAVECTGEPGAANTLYYYSFATTTAMNQGYSNLLSGTSFPNSCGASDGKFDEFSPPCQSTYTNSSPVLSGTVTEYLNQDNDPAIATTEDTQLVICAMIGTDGSDLLTFWNNSDWIATGD